MSILVRSGDDFFEIPAEVLERCKISKEEFLERVRRGDVQLAEKESPCNFVEFGSSCTLDDEDS